jgi:hypothetical protein
LAEFKAKLFPACTTAAWVSGSFTARGKDATRGKFHMAVREKKKNTGENEENTVFRIWVLGQNVKEKKI